MLDTRELGLKRDMQARGPFTGFLSWAFMSLPIRLRDLTPDELAGSDTVDEIFDAYMSNHVTREPSPQQETQARGIPDSDDITKPMARDNSLSAMNELIDAFSKSLDSPKRELTADDVLSFASLASRALDELD